MLKLHNATGLVEPRPHTGGSKPTIDKDMLLQIESMVLETPDITLQEIKDALGLTISTSIICDAINKKLNLRYKKTLSTQGRIAKMRWRPVKIGQMTNRKWMAQVLYFLAKVA